MTRLRLIGPFALACLALVACAAAPDDGAATSTANDTTQTTSGPLTPDPSFAGSGALAITGGGVALGAAARSDGTIAVARNRAKDTVVTLVKSDGTASSDVVLPGVSNASTVLVLPHNDGVVAVGSGKQFFLARIGADGNLDPKFRPDPLNIDVADAAVTKDGHIIVAGTLKTVSKAAIVRLTANGSIDPSFAGGQGAWIDDATATGATHAVVDASGVITFITVGANGTNALRLDGTGKLDPSYGRSGRASIAAVQPKHGSALVAGDKGAITYVSSSATSEANSAFVVDRAGNVTSTTAVAGTVDGATMGGLESYETNADACTLHIGDTTAMLSAAQCGEPAPYVTLPDGRHAIAVTTPGADPTANAVSIHMFAP